MPLLQSLAVTAHDLPMRTVRSSNRPAVVRDASWPRARPIVPNGNRFAVEGKHRERREVRVIP